MVQCYPGLDFNFSLFYLFIYLFIFLICDNEIVTKESHFRRHDVNICNLQQMVQQTGRGKG